MSIQKNLQKTREFERDQLKLDITQTAATAYLNILQAKSFEKIQQENLKLTRQNLEFARVREVVGSAGKDELSTSNRPTMNVQHRTFNFQCPTFITLRFIYFKRAKLSKYVTY